MGIRTHRWRWRIALGAWGVIAVAGAMAWTAYSTTHDALARMSPDDAAGKAARAALTRHTGGAITILLLGSDRRDGRPDLGARSDTMMLARLDPDTNSLNLLSIPRDLMADIPGYGRTKINAAYAHRGPAGAIDAVQSTLGVTINHYVDVNFGAFFALIQHIGGVWVPVDRRYYNPEGTGWAPIDIHPGYQRLNGNDALDFVRYRHTDSDFTRAARQQLVLQSVLDQARDALGAGDVPDLLRIAGENMRTDIRDVQVLAGIVNQARDVDAARIQRIRFPAQQSVRGVDADPSALARVRERFLAPAPAPADDTPRPESLVANAGAGVGGAERVAARLRAAGYPARGIGNANAAGVSWRPAIYARTGEQRSAMRVAGDALGLDVRPLRAAVRGADVIVVIDEQQQASGGAPADDLVRAPEFSFRGAPTRIPRGSALSDSEGLRRYVISDRSGSHRATAATFYDPTIGHWAIQRVQTPDPPLLRSARPVGAGANGRAYRAVWSGGRMRVLAWPHPGGWSWVANSLDLGLTPGQMRSIADSIR